MSAIATSISQSLKHRKRASPKLEDLTDVNNHPEGHSKNDFEIIKVPKHQYHQPSPRPQTVNI